MPTLLVIEDEPKLLRFLGTLLQEEGYHVLLESDGQRGLRRALTESYDLLILDRMLPGTDGLTICRQVRRARPSMPILILTAKDAIAERVEGLDAGADDYLVKPFAFDELLARLRALERRAHPPTSPGNAGMAVGPFLIDEAQRQVSIDGQVRSLSAKELVLLATLARHPGRVFSRSELLEQVWGYDADVSEKEVDVYCHYLRKKLRPFGADKMIESVRGFGYRLNLTDRRR
ncbi:MAG: response regulator transcription factor [Firmicutes bacterium]|nr:response regulator transcription factor [Bacillota bacterium]